MSDPVRRFVHQGPLDGLRAIAILIVMLSHVGLERLIPGGFGVTIFFFLSGYLITSLLRDEFAREGGVDLGEFYKRRALRILPPFLVAMAVVALAMSAGLLPGKPDPLGLLAQALFLSSYSTWLHLPTGVEMPLWSLAIEEHFYIVFPLLLTLMLRRWPPAVAAGWCAVGCVVALGLRVFHGLAQGEAGLFENYYMTHTRFDSLLFGCILALWNNPAMEAAAWRPKAWQFAAALGLIVATMVYREPFFRDTLRYSLQGIGLFVVFSYLLSATGWLRAALSAAPVQWVALLSYTAYLVHFPIIKGIGMWLPDAPIWVVAGITFPLTFLLAWGMYVLVERPIREWRRQRQVVRTA